MKPFSERVYDSFRVFKGKQITAKLMKSDYGFRYPMIFKILSEVIIYLISIPVLLIFSIKYSILGVKFAEFMDSIRKPHGDKAASEDKYIFEFKTKIAKLENQAIRDLQGKNIINSDQKNLVKAKSVLDKLKKDIHNIPTYTLYQIPTNEIVRGILIEIDKYIENLPFHLDYINFYFDIQTKIIEKNIGDIHRRQAKKELPEEEVKKESAGKKSQPKLQVEIAEDLYEEIEDLIDGSENIGVKSLDITQIDNILAAGEIFIPHFSLRPLMQTTKHQASVTKPSLPKASTLSQGSLNTIFYQARSDDSSPEPVVLITEYQASVTKPPARVATMASSERQSCGIL